MTLPDLILAVMLAIQPPGRTAYSTVKLATCDDVCQTTRPCSEDTILCRAPAWSPNAKAWWRYEQPDEGRARYATIAKAIADTAGEGWPYVVTVMNHESGFRRDVHEGVGKWSRGDGGHSWSLGQILLDRAGAMKAPVTGYTGRELVGLGDAATRRCAETVWAYLSAGLAACGPVATASCVFTRYGGLSGPDPRIAARVGTFDKARAIAAGLGGVTP